MFSRGILLMPRTTAPIARWQPRHDSPHWMTGCERFLSMDSRIPARAENGEPYSPAGKERLAWLMQHNIGLYGELKRVNKLRWKSMTVEMASRHTLQYSDLNYFTTQKLSYAVEVCRRYVADNAKPLWWRTQAQGSRPVVRNKATARLNVAFRQALQKAGYDIQGKRLPGPHNGPRPGNETITHLFGTVVIKIHLPVAFHNVPFDELQDYCKKIVIAMEKVLGQRPGAAGKRAQAGPGEKEIGRSSGSRNDRRGGRSNGRERQWRQR
jgi:hypothetical protein